MPSGSRSTGRNTPKTPGSINDAEESTGTRRASSRGDASRITLCMRRHRSHHENAKTANPVAHSAIRIGASSLADCDGCEAGAGPSETSAPKGSFTCSMICGTPSSAPERAGVVAAGRANWLPASTSSEHGTRNLADAASHRQYRACARLFLRSRVRRPAIPANSVDCQRWFAMGNRLPGIIPASPFCQLSECGTGLAQFLRS